MNLENRPEFFTCHNGEKAELPFSQGEYQRRIARLRDIMKKRDVAAVVLTSMHNIAYYSGFLYCSFGRPYACVITDDECTTVSANIDAGQPWRRSISENVIYTDWKRNNFYRAVASLLKGATKIGIEGDHVTVTVETLMREMLGARELIDIAPDTMMARMIKSDEEITLIKAGAHVADVGAYAIKSAIREGESGSGNCHCRARCNGTRNYSPLSKG